MALERNWPAVAPQLFTSDGSVHGLVTVANTRGFKVKANAAIEATGQPKLLVEVKRVISATQLFVGAIGKPISDRSVNLSAYTVAAGAFIYAEEQVKAQLTKADQDHATYDQEPTVARRSVMVDQLGRYYEEANPLPVQLSGGSIFIETVHNNVSVFLTHRDNYPNVGDEHDSVRVGNGIYEMDVNPDGSINTNTYQNLLLLLNNFNFLKNANPDEIVPTFAGTNATFSYLEDGVEIAKVFATYVNSTNWSIRHERYLIEDDGEKLTDDNDEPLLLE